MEWIKKFFKEEEGTEVVEYAIILGLIVVLSIGAIGTVGGYVSTWWTSIQTELAL